MKYVYYHKLECRATVSAAGPCEKNNLGPLTFPSVNTASGCAGGKLGNFFYYPRLCLVEIEKYGK